MKNKSKNIEEDMSVEEIIKNMNLFDKELFIDNDKLTPFSKMLLMGTKRLFFHDRLKNKQVKKFKKEIIFDVFDNYGVATKIFGYHEHSKLEMLQMEISLLRKKLREVESEKRGKNTRPNPKRDAWEKELIYGKTKKPKRAKTSSRRIKRS